MRACRGMVRVRRALHAFAHLFAGIMLVRMVASKQAPRTSVYGLKMAVKGPFAEDWRMLNRHWL